MNTVERDDVAAAPILLGGGRRANLLALEAAIEGLGRPVVSARTESEAIALASLIEPAVVLLDLEGIGAGFETAAQIAGERLRPIVLLTDRADVARGYASGAADVLFEPFDPDVVRAKVAFYVALHEQRVAVERERAVLADRLRLVLDTSGLGTWEYDARRDVLHGDDTWRALVGAPRTLDELRALLGDEDRAAFDAAFPDGAKVDVHVAERAIALRWIRNGDDGAARSVIGTVLDLTPRRRADEERDRLTAELAAAHRVAEAAQRVKENFLTIVSHELRTPLHAALGWCQLLLTEDAVAPERVRAACEVIARNVDAQVRLIDDILEASSIANGDLRMSLAPVDLAAIARKALDHAATAIAAKGLFLEAGVMPDACWTIADATRIQQVFWNLLANAVKFTPAGGKVAFSLERRDSVARLVVSDEGVGIDPEFLPHVFDRFRQADSSTTRAYGGLGIGLSIVRHIVELHGGTVDVESLGPGRGASFAVHLPLREPQGSSHEEAAPSASGQRGSVT
ncbi:MAG: hypothetical protein KIT84_44895 [Labilithrix sp.]|nr:hypothetical protein [Labilithrix sp.]MCW5818220.1 hypothetical protein [Labilithrix sp.]